MIIIYLGGIGSGKTLSAVKEIIDRDSYAYTGFELKNFSKYHRLSFSDILLHSENKDKKLVPYDVNWDFWKKAVKDHPNFSIFIDEAHNVISSRSSLSKRNKLMSNWISQIRKILYSSSENHIYIITQTWRRLDINFRELAHLFIECESFTASNGKTYVKQRIYNGIDQYMMNKVYAKRIFCGNKYFKYYDTHAIDMMGSGEEYI